MGTASTMACIAEALGMMLPGSAAIPAVHADRHARRRGDRRAPPCGMAASELTPDQILTPQAVENALRVLLAIGGSTNAHRPPDRDRRPRWASTIDLKRSNEMGRRRRRCWST